jgi:cytochrome c-type protein NapB
MTPTRKANGKALFAVVVVSVAIAGYFTGLQAPMKVTARTAPAAASEPEASDRLPLGVGVIPATHYSDMAALSVERGPHTQLASLKSVVKPLAEIRIDPQEKLTALQQRARNRAFNGAPPTIPHAIDQQSDASCVACHKDGVLTESLRISRMSHAFLPNCTQCHVESHPRHLPATVFRENSFAGLPAPTAGPRAFASAPPQIPHSTWMRSDCMSCHGYEGLHGLRTTHPWRNSCQQCHAPSAEMEQTLLTPEPQFLPTPDIRE